MTRMVELPFRVRTQRLSAPVVMGVLNVTPDSFSDGGRFNATDAALRQARRMLDDGAGIIDVGGESTRPGAKPVSTQQELDRVMPVLQALAAETDMPLSVDTSSPQVMREAAAAGVVLINDVRALQRPGALEAAATSGLPVCLMHMQGAPPSMQARPGYADVVAEVRNFLESRIDACEAAGIARQRLLIDPGFGFGKSLAHNLTLLRELDAFHRLGLPLLVGMSRKSMIDKVLGRPVEQRLSGSLALALLAAQRGAAVIRVHDVRETVDALRITDAVLHGMEESPT